MSKEPDFLAANRANWDERVPVHMASTFYDVEGWLRDRPGPRSWEREVLGNLKDLEVAHLQCHFGQDTLALADAGARVTGLDLSPAAVDAARALAERAGLAERSRFVVGNVLEAAEHLPTEAFDLVYVSLGALCWLPSVRIWADQVHALLKPGGRLYLHDTHPLTFALADDELRIVYPYFEEPEPFVEDSGITYTDGETAFTHTRTYEWSHSIGEIATALLDLGMRLDRLDEHDWTVFPRFEWLPYDGQGRWWCPPDRRIPLSITVLATKQ